MKNKQVKIKQNVSENKQDLVNINNLIKIFLLHLFIKEKSAARREIIFQELDRLAKLNHFNVAQEIFNCVGQTPDMLELEAQTKDVLTYRPIAPFPGLEE